MSDFNADLLQETKQAIDKHNEVLEKMGADNSEFKRVQDNIQTQMKKFDDQNEKLVKEIEDERKQKEELKERVEHLEKLGAMAADTSNPETSAKDCNDVVNAMLKGQAAWNNFIKEAYNESKAQRVFAEMAKMPLHDLGEASKMGQMITAIKASPDLLRSDIGELGGYLCPDEYSTVLEKTMIEYGPIRRFARVKRTASKVYKQPVRNGIPVASRPGEAQTGNTSTSVYTMEDWNPARLTNTTPVTLDELAYNAYDLAGELIKDNAEAFAVREGQEFFNGNGINQGLGFTIDPNVPEFQAIGSTTPALNVNFDDIINVTGELKMGYNPMYCFNRRTLAFLRTLKDDNGRYLWNGPFGDAASGSPATINGYRYSADFIEFDDVDVSSGFSILFADMLRFFLIVDRTDVTIIRDEYTRKKEAIVEYTMNKWCVGKPFIKEAGVRIKNKA